MTIDPNALKNKYMQKDQKEADTSLYIHRHVDEDQINEKPDDNGGRTDRTNYSKNAPYLK